ncbi:MAG: hypothetical protein ACJAVS_002130 [Paracoccaceae bacterium]|jgi:hypothetical protein
MIINDINVLRAKFWMNFVWFVSVPVMMASLCLAAAEMLVPS